MLREVLAAREECGCAAIDVTAVPRGRTFIEQLDVAVDVEPEASAGT